MTEILEQLIDDVYDQNVEGVKEHIEVVNKDSFLQKFENGNTLLHYVFSCNNAEIITLFVSRLESLINDGTLSQDQLKGFLEMRSNGGTTVADTILEENAAEKIGAALKGIHNVTMLKAFLEAKNEDGMTVYEIAKDELSKEELKGFAKDLKSGAEHLHTWSDWAWSFVSTPDELKQKQALVEQHLGNDIHLAKPYATNANTTYAVSQHMQDAALNRFASKNKPAPAGDMHYDILPRLPGGGMKKVSSSPDLQQLRDAPAVDAGPAVDAALQADEVDVAAVPGAPEDAAQRGAAPAFQFLGRGGGMRRQQIILKARKLKAPAKVEDEKAPAADAGMKKSSSSPDLQQLRDAPALDGARVLEVAPFMRLKTALQGVLDSGILGKGSIKTIQECLAKFNSGKGTAADVRGAIEQVKGNYQQKGIEERVKGQVNEALEPLEQLIREGDVVVQEVRAKLALERKAGGANDLAEEKEGVVEEGRRADGAKEERLTQNFKETAINFALVARKLPQFADDINYFAKEIGGSEYALDKLVEIKLGQSVDFKSMGSTIVVASGVTLSAATMNPIPVTLAIFGTETGYNAWDDWVAQPLTGGNENYLYALNTGGKLVGGTALGFFLGGPVLGVITLGLVGSSVALDSGIKYGYVSEKKPAFTMGSKAVDVAYSFAINKLLIAAESLHLVRQGHESYKSYTKSFEITDDQFPVLSKYGYLATELYDKYSLYSKNTADYDVRDSYNTEITKFFYKHFAKQAKELHCAGKEIPPELAREASELRNEVKYLHHLVTPLYGRVSFDLYKLYKYGTPINPDYNSLSKSKSDHNIFYDSFRTNGKLLGLENNGMEDVLNITARLNENAALLAESGKTTIYPEDLKQGAVECVQKLDHSNSFEEVFKTCADYFDLTCA